MNSESGYETIARTRSTWLALTGAGILWVGACVWAYSSVEFGVMADAPTGARLAMKPQTRLALSDAEEQARLDGQAAAATQRQQTTELEAARLDTLALEAEEQVRLEAQEQASERRRVASAQAAKQAADARAAQAAKQAADAREVQAAKLAADTKAAQAAKQAADTRAAQAAKLVADTREVQAAKLAADARKVQEAADASAAERERVRQAASERQRAALPSQSSGVDVEARRAAAAEASRIAALARQQRNYISARGTELGVLSGLSSRLRFTRGSATVSRQTERVLDDIFNPLYLYSEALILVSVATNEYDGSTEDDLLSRDRGRAIASYLISRGLEKERFRIHIESGDELSAGTHRVRISSEEVD